MDTLSLSVNAVSYTVAAELAAADDPFNGPVGNIAPWNFTILAVLMFVVTSLSLSENFLVMFVTFKFKQLRQPLNYIIVNLAIADFLVSLTGGLISFLTNARGYFFLGRWACVLEGFAVTFFGRFTHWSFYYCRFIQVLYTQRYRSATFTTVDVSVGAFFNWCVAKDGRWWRAIATGHFLTLSASGHESEHLRYRWSKNEKDDKW